jgi:hypothetical protein
MTSRWNASTAMTWIAREPAEEREGDDCLLPCRLLALTIKMAAIDLCHCHLNFAFFASFATFFGDCSSSVVGVLRHQRATGVADWFDTELNQKRVDLRLEREAFALGGLLDHIDGHERHSFIWHPRGARQLARRPMLKAFAVPQSDCYPIAKCI